MSISEQEIKNLALENKKRYIYQNEEVYATGRIAERKSTASTRRVGSVVKSDSLLIEIKPVFTTNGDWVKWVQETELYEILVHKVPLV